MEKHNILQELPEKTKVAVHLLNYIMEGHGDYPHLETREQDINMLKEQISDVVLTILMREDK